VIIYLCSLPGAYLLAKKDASSIPDLQIFDFWLQISTRKCAAQSTISHLHSTIPSFLLGLAPDGGYLAADIATGAGERLTRLFTLT
jgi:hypothetical protein